MTTSKFIKHKNGSLTRCFYVLTGENWVKVQFDDITEGNRFFYFEDGKRSETWIARGAPFMHARYGCYVVEAIYAYTMDETISNKDIHKAINGKGLCPIYVTIDGKTLPVENFKMGVHGEIVLEVATDKSGQHVKYSDDIGGDGGADVRSKTEITHVDDLAFVEPANQIAA